MIDYRAPRWLAGAGNWGGNLQTVWPALFARSHLDSAPRFERERWATPDGDFIDLDWLRQPIAAGARQRRLLVLFHGLEGSSASSYSQAFASQARQLGWDFVMPHFRGCSGELNHAPRAYHSGDYEEIGWILQRLRELHPAGVGPLLAVGVSLGGNALLRWIEEAGSSAAITVDAAAAVSSPVDLAAGGHAIGQGFNRQVYTRMFLRSMVPKALAKLAQHPGLFDRHRLLAARNLYDFDNVFTAPLHGFRDTDDYWARGSAKPHLAQIRIPTLVLNARNDPFVPAASLPREAEVGHHVRLWQPAEGGHVGFPAGAPPGDVLTMPRQVLAWLDAPDVG